MRQQFRGSQLWTAHLAGEVAAFALTEHDDDLSWLESLAVARRHQGQGIGAALAVVALLGDGVGRDRSAGLRVSSRNATAIRLYERLGFTARSEKWKYAALRDDVLAKIQMSGRSCAALTPATGIRLLHSSAGRL